MLYAELYFKSLSVERTRLFPRKIHFCEVLVQGVGEPLRGGPAAYMLRASSPVLLHLSGLSRSLPGAKRQLFGEVERRERLLCYGEKRGFGAVNRIRSKFGGPLLK